MSGIKSHLTFKFKINFKLHYMNSSMLMSGSCYILWSRQNEVAHSPSLLFDVYIMTGIISTIEGLHSDK